MSGRIHILRSTGHYLGQVRRAGYRRWETVTGRCKTCESAIAKAAPHFKGKKRMRVLFIDDNPYFGPHIAFEGAK